MAEDLGDKASKEDTGSQKMGVKRVGCLRGCIGEQRPKYWVDHQDFGSRHDADIAEAAVAAGYRNGDFFTYTVIINPKK